MRFTVNKKQFSDALTHVVAAVPNNSPRPILHNVLLAVDADDSVMLSGTDLEVAVRTPVAAAVEEGGKILLPAKKLLDLVKRIACEEMRFEVRDETAFLSGGGKFRLAGCGESDYPAFPEVDVSGGVSMPPGIFRGMAEKSLFCVAKGDTRYSLNGVYVAMHESGLVEFSGSDAHRLSLETFDAEEKREKPMDGIVLAKGMATMARLAEGAGVVRFALGGHGAVAAMDGTVVYSRLIDGMYPSIYREIGTPPEKHHFFVVRRDEFVNALGAIGVLASAESRTVILGIGEDSLTLTAEDEGDGGTIRLDAEVHGRAGVDIKLNYTFLLDVLRYVHCSGIMIRYTEASAPCFIASGSFTHTIMSKE